MRTPGTSESMRRRILDLMADMCCQVTVSLGFRMLYTFMDSQRQDIYNIEAMNGELVFGALRYLMSPTDADAHYLEEGGEEELVLTCA
jgi:hypothetical protein